jgi:hypothetical protein
MTLIRVYTDIGESKPVELFAKIFNTVKKTHQVKYLSPTGNHNALGKEIYNYESVMYEIDDKSITQYLKTDDEESIGFKKTEDGFIKLSDEESEYEPSESSSSGDGDSDDESVVTEEDEIDDDEYDD